MKWFVYPYQKEPVPFDTEEDAIEYRKWLLKHDIYSTHGINNTSGIQEITTDEAIKIIDTRFPLGLFYHRDGDIFVGIDNTTNEAWTEEFANIEDCRNWLNGEEKDF